MDLGNSELQKRLVDIDMEAYLVYGNSAHFTCYIVGGSALIIMGYISRATRDIDTIEASPSCIRDIFEKYDMNLDVQAFSQNFAADFKSRAKKIEILTRTVDFYTLSLEDIVVSKLCSDFSSTRIHDWEDIRTPEILDIIDWNLLDKIKNQVKQQQISVFTAENLEGNYKEYIEEYKK